MTGKSFVRLITATLIIASVVFFFELAWAQEPIQMTLEGSFSVGSSSASACIICVPPSSSGSIELVVDFETGSVSGNVSGEGSGQGSGTCCDDNGQPLPGEAIAHGTTSFSGGISGSVDPQSGAITAKATLQGTWSGSWAKCECDECSVLGQTSFTREATITGVVTRDGSASGQISWASPTCGTGGSWTAQATAITSDRDGDGLPDNEDACPDEYAETEDGCPSDRDNDGLPDDEDACPDEYAETEDGCPSDRDNDGLPDDEDACPDEYAETEDGCPAAPVFDRDGDGIPNDRDDCPNDYAETENGCPGGPASDEEADFSRFLENLFGGKATTAELVRDLEDFLAGKGVNGPTPGQAAAGGAISATLLGGWMLSQLLSGASREDLLKALKEWQRGGSARGQEVKLISEAEKVTPTEAEEVAPTEAKKVTPTEAKRAPPPEATTVPEAEKPAPRKVPRPIEEAEEQLRRRVDTSDEYLRAWEETRQDFKRLLDKIPGKLKDTDFWKNKVQPQIDKILQTTDPEKARRLLDETKILLDIRQPWKKALRHVDADKYEGGIWLERGGRIAGQIAGKLHQTLIIDPLKKWAETLPKPQAEAVKKFADGHQKDIARMFDDLRKVPRVAAQNVKGGEQMAQQLDDMQKHMPRAYEQLRRDTEIPLRPEDKPDFGKGLKKLEPVKKKIEECWEGIRTWWDKYGLVAGRRVKPLDLD